MLPAPTSELASRVLVTGASGFIGRHLADALLAAGKSVSLIVKSGSEADCLERWGTRVSIFAFDGSSASMQAIMRSAQPDTVFHLASRFLAQHTPEDVPSLIGSNLLFGTQLLDAMRECSVPYFINAGTSWQHFEQDSYAPVNLYAASKQAFEAMLRYYSDACGLSAITLKLFDTYGPKDPRPKLIHLLQKSQDAAEPLALSPGEQVLDLLYIDDVVAAFMQAATLIRTHAPGHHAYGLPSGERLRLRDLVSVVESTTGRPCHIAWGTRPYRPREVMQPWSGEPVLPGWAPRVSLFEGIKLTLG